LWEGGYQAWRRLRAEKLEGVRVEGDGRRQGIASPRLFHYPTEDLLMAEVEAVEIPDGEHGRGQGRTQVLLPVGQGIEEAHGHQSWTSKERPS
jgi:hypothetical protein